MTLELLRKYTMFLHYLRNAYKGFRLPKAIEGNQNIILDWQSVKVYIYEHMVIYGIYGHKDKYEELYTVDGFLQTKELQDIFSKLFGDSP